jgi:GNAT superfamily N-acetyltransferase
MVKSELVSEPLSERHAVENFRCGYPSLDEWLSGSALHAQANRTARTFIWHRGDAAVVAYFSLSAAIVRRAELPKKVGRGAPETIPAVLLARLALHQSLHGTGLGAELLFDALSRTLRATEHIGARLLVVDAIDEKAAGFYERYGFTRIPGTPRLAQKVSDIAAAMTSR